MCFLWALSCNAGGCIVSGVLCLCCMSFCLHVFVLWLCLFLWLWFVCVLCRALCFAVAFRVRRIFIAMVRMIVYPFIIYMDACMVRCSWCDVCYVIVGVLCMLLRYPCWFMYLLYVRVFGVCLSSLNVIDVRPVCVFPWACSLASPLSIFPQLMRERVGAWSCRGRSQADPEAPPKFCRPQPLTQHVSQKGPHSDWGRGRARMGAGARRLRAQDVRGHSEGHSREATADKPQQGGRGREATTGRPQQRGIPTHNKNTKSKK